MIVNGNTDLDVCGNNTLVDDFQIIFHPGIKRWQQQVSNHGVIYDLSGPINVLLITSADFCDDIKM